jgi:hypothetical protein
MSKVTRLHGKVKISTNRDINSVVSQAVSTHPRDLYSERMKSVVLAVGEIQLLFHQDSRGSKPFHFARQTALFRRQLAYRSSVA